MFTAFSIGSQWQAIRNAVTTVESKAADHEKRVKLLEASMVFWRREVERKLGPLPDFQPIDNGETDAKRRTRNLQAHQMLIRGQRPSAIDREPTGDRTGRDHSRQAPSVDRHSDEGVGGN
jgi:hypothetical protein